MLKQHAWSQIKERDILLKRFMKGKRSQSTPGHVYDFGLWTFSLFLFIYLFGGRGFGSQTWSPGLQAPKLHTEKSCRIQWSVSQIKPYVASDGLISILGPQCQMVQVWVVGLWPTSACQNFRIWRNLDPGVSAWVEPAPILAKTCSTPGLRPGIRPRQKRPGRILGLE